MRFEYDNSAKWDPQNRQKTKSPEAEYLVVSFEFDPILGLWGVLTWWKLATQGNMINGLWDGFGGEFHPHTWFIRQGDLGASI